MIVVGMRYELGTRTELGFTVVYDMYLSGTMYKKDVLYEI